jgi:hypothetical protein
LSRSEYFSIPFIPFLLFYIIATIGRH